MTKHSYEEKSNAKEANSRTWWFLGKHAQDMSFTSIKYIADEQFNKANFIHISEMKTDIGNISVTLPNSVSETAHSRRRYSSHHKIPSGPGKGHTINTSPARRSAPQPPGGYLNLHRQPITTSPTH